MSSCASRPFKMFGLLEISALCNLIRSCMLVRTLFHPSQELILTNSAAQAEALAKSLDLVLKGKDPVAYVPDPTPKGAVSIGRSKGTGRFGTWRIPSIIVWLAKGRTLGIQYLQGAVTGSAY